MLNGMVNTFESTAKIGQKCPDCDFTTTSKVDLKKHTNRVNVQALGNGKDETLPSTYTDFVGLNERLRYILEKITMKKLNAHFVT